MMLPGICWTIYWGKNMSVIQEKIKRPLADLIEVFSLSQGGIAHVSVKSGELDIVVEGELAEV